MERGSLEEINSRLEMANEALRVLCGRAARALSAGACGNDTEDTLKLVAELEAVGRK